MSEDITDVLQKGYDAVNRGDFDGFLAVLDPEVEFMSLIAEADGRTYRGHAGARDWWDSVSAPLGGLQIEARSMRAEGNVVVAHILGTATMKGVQVAQAMWHVVRLRDGKAIWWTFGRTEREVLQAVGLGE
jgi:ketosteroid isomerase-like protein